MECCIIEEKYSQLMKESENCNGNSFICSDCGNNILLFNKENH